MQIPDTEQIPERSPDQDEAIIVQVLRRTDPDNPDGSPDPDLSLSSVALGQQLVDQCIAMGFDPSQSYVGVVGLVDVEVGGCITLADLAALQQG